MTKRIKLTFSKYYLLLFLVLLSVEICIALFAKDNFIRPLLGDVLVIPLLYGFLRTFMEAKAKYLTIGILLFAYTLEVGQYFNLASMLGLENHKVLRIMIGSTFDLRDFLAYTIGAALILFSHALASRINNRGSRV